MLFLSSIPEMIYHFASTPASYFLKKNFYQRQLQAAMRSGYILSKTLHKTEAFAIAGQLIIPHKKMKGKEDYGLQKIYRK